MATLDDLLIGVGVSGMRDLRSDFDRVTRMADDAVDTTESLFDRMSLRAPTDPVRDDLFEVGDWARKAADETDAAFEGMYRDINGRLRDQNGKFVKAGEEQGRALGEGIKRGTSRGTDGLSSGLVSKFGSIGKKLAVSAAGAGALAGAALVHEFLDAIEDERLEDKLGATLDLTADKADEYGQLASDLYAGAWGDSLAEVYDAIDAVSSTLGDLDLDEIEDLTVNALDLAAAFDTDVDEAVNSAGVLMKTGLADDGEEAFDLITKAMQSVPRLMRGELLPIIEEYSQDFAGLGIDGPDAMGLLVEAAKVGRFELDKTGDAIKELTIRASDMSEASQEAYEKMGLDAQQMSAMILAGGQEAREAFDLIIDGLLDIEDPVDQANTAIALFGTPLEDLSVTEIPAFLERMDQMGGKFGEVEGAAGRMGDTLNTNVATDIESFKRRAGSAIDEWVEEYVVPNAVKVLDAFEEDGVGGAIDKALELWEEAWPKIDAWIDNVAIPTAKEWGTKVARAFVDGINEIDLFPDIDQWVKDLGGDIDDLWVSPWEDQGSKAGGTDPIPKPPAPSETYNPDRSGIEGGRTANAAGTTINVTNNYLAPSTGTATTESIRRAAMEFA